MSNDKATPRPWAVEEEARYPVVLMRVRGPNRQLVATLISQTTLERTEDRANFALIIEAVNSHDALRAQNAELVDALTHVTDLLNDPGVGDLEQWKRGVREWTSRARALAKAGVKSLRAAAETIE